MSKTPAELDREVQEAVGLPPAIVKKWRTKIAACKKTLRELEASYSEPAFWKAVRARDALDKIIDEACQHAYTPGASPYQSPPIAAMVEEKKALYEGGLEPVSARGREANYRARMEESKRLKAEEREIQRPYDWMKH
jgi:hypothetical protein